jgi:hypothetical protein
MISLRRVNRGGHRRRKSKDRLPERAVRPKAPSRGINSRPIAV